MFSPKTQRGSDKKGTLHIKLERTALLHIRDFECDVAALANAKRDSARNPRSAAFDYVSCVKLKYERIRMKNTTFVAKGEPIEINVARFLPSRYYADNVFRRFYVFFNVNRSRIISPVHQRIRLNFYLAIEHLLYHRSVQRNVDI